MCNFGISKSYFFEDNVLKLIFYKQILSIVNTFALAKREVVMHFTFCGKFFIIYSFLVG